MPNATTGSWSRIPRCGLGSQPIIVTGELWDQMVDALNAFGCLTVNPTANGISFMMDRNAATLDATRFEQRIAALEGYLAVPATGGNSTSITQQITTIQNNFTVLQSNVTVIEGRLSNATATANCVGNVVITTITI